ncbi:MAG: hypothetical protein LHV68_05110 [Elusimicrobia bacterium]|nr:hypothetical protein [Candidatus Liberimonas magnetica]
MLGVYKLSLKPDNEISSFKRLSFKSEPVPLSKVLREGIHPGFNLEDCSDGSKIRSRLQEITNEDKYLPPELKQMDYSNEFSHSAYDYSEKDKLKLLLEDIRDNIYFVDADIKFQELLEIAKVQLKKKWGREAAKDILLSCYREFNELRSFVKSKDENVKITSYEDLSDIPLEKILKVEDFLAFEKVLISHGLEVHNFRYSDYLKGICTQEGYLSLKPSISEFQFRYPVKGECIVYNALLSGDTVTCYPELSVHSERHRVLAIEFAEKYGTDTKYCPLVPLSTIEELQNQNVLRVYFANINYEQEDNALESYAGVKKEAVKYYMIENFLNETAPAKKLREILKQFDEKISGNKVEIIDRYTDNATQEYNKLLPKLDKYFAGRKYVKVNSSNDEDGQEFVVLKDNPIKNLILTMYFIKHLRGNVMFDTGYENDAYSVSDLAKALISRKVSLEGVFVGVKS